MKAQCVKTEVDCMFKHFIKCCGKTLNYGNHHPTFQWSRRKFDSNVKTRISASLSFQALWLEILEKYWVEISMNLLVFSFFPIKTLLKCCEYFIQNLSTLITYYRVNLGKFHPFFIELNQKSNVNRYWHVQCSILAEETTHSVAWNVFSPFALTVYLWHEDRKIWFQIIVQTWNEWNVNFNM